MRHEISAFGLMFPSLLLCGVLAAVLWFLFDWLMLRLRVWRFFWHPPLARLALFFAIFAAVSSAYPDF